MTYSRELVTFNAFPQTQYTIHKASHRALFSSSSDSGGRDKQSSPAAAEGVAVNGGAAERLVIKLVRGGRMVGRRPQGFTVDGREFKPTLNWRVYIFLVGIPCLRTLLLDHAAVYARFALPEISRVFSGRKVVGYTVGTWFVILSALTIAVNADEDVSYVCYLVTRALSLPRQIACSHPHPAPLIALPCWALTCRSASCSWLLSVAAV